MTPAEWFFLAGMTAVVVVAIGIIFVEIWGDTR